MPSLAGRQLDHPKVPLTFKRHILPPLLGIGMTLAIYAGLNMQLLQAKWHALRYKPAVMAPTPNPAPSPAAAVPPESIKKPDPLKPQPAPDIAPRLIIPAIGVDAPVVYDEPSREEWKVLHAIRRGVLHYGGTALPGQKGNNVVFGHSSAYAWEPGDYKFVFSLLGKLQNGDQIHMDYEGYRYTYTVTGRKVVKPQDIWIVEQTSNHQLSVVTCWPVGSDKERLVIIAELTAPQLVR